MPKSTYSNPFSGQKLTSKVLSLSFLMLASAAESQAIALGLPVDCSPGQDCFVQQAPDLDMGPGVLDPSCGAATYDGHEGWDIRLPSMPDIASNIAVLAAESGVVVGIRDGMADELVLSEAERSGIRGRECGNGVVLSHGLGLVTQYCHLRQGSVTVAQGDTVEKGQRIGAVGASGLAAFPHVHLSVRRGDAKIEPLTGLPVDVAATSCGDYSRTMFDDNARQFLELPAAPILGIGLSSVVPDTATLVREGPPALAGTGDSILLAWVWAINLEKGWRIRLRLFGPGQNLISENTTDPLSTRKADYVAYAGRRRPPESGEHSVEVQILDGEMVVISELRTFVVE